jgi:Zn-dependent metalloprotease
MKVFQMFLGSLAKQYRLNQTADEADWLIGKDIFKDNSNWALRSTKKSGTANPYDNQPMNFSDYHPSPNDINSRVLVIMPFTTRRSNEEINR